MQARKRRGGGACFFYKYRRPYGTIKSSTYLHFIPNASWGEKTVQELADFIEQKHPDLKGFNRRGLYRMKQFYETYAKMSFAFPLHKDIENQADIIVSSPMTQLGKSDIRNTILAKVSWTHHLTLISRCKREEEREFYLRLCIKENYSVKELDRQINSSLFERVMLGKLQLSSILQEIHTEINPYVKDSYVFEFLNLPEKHSEKTLQKRLIQEMKHFILELGKDFLFVGSEYQLQVGNSDFYIDLLFYHRSLQCLVAFELKTVSFKPEHLGQLNFYLEALDQDVKKANENPSIGILLCRDQDQEVVKYALNRSLSPTMVAEYTTLLPDKRLLQQKLHEIFENN